MPAIPWAMHRHKLVEALQDVERLQTDAQDAANAVPLETYRGEDAEIHTRLVDPPRYDAYWAIRTRSIVARHALKEVLALVEAELPLQGDAVSHCPRCQGLGFIYAADDPTEYTASNTWRKRCPTCHGQPYTPSEPT